MKIAILSTRDVNRHEERKHGAYHLSSNRIYGKCVKASIAALALAAFVWAAPAAQAGVIPYAGKLIMQGTNAAAAATASGGEAAVGEATGAAKATGGFLSSAASDAGNALVSAGRTVGTEVEQGAGTVASGARQVPGVVARNTTAGARSLWHAIW
ncbi:MAG: hypothetical protein M1404_03195 [Acidobacteria bacterium]|nr:hypothetical protein [Acidobacteriota bacterium]